ncbi:MAG: hypothetical protein KDA92_15415 [Planctomycetales bacterium]|nr:hypothetical protein [Planctomycetales bacterium]
MNLHRVNVLGRSSTWVLLVGLLVAQLSPLNAATLTAPQQLPDQTVVFLRINDTRELVRRFQDTSLGLALQDPQLSPLVKQLWGSVIPMLDVVKEQSGVSVEELLSSAPGELVVAMLRIPGFPPVPVLMFQADANDSTWDVLQKGEDKLVEGGFQRATEEFQGVSAQILSTDNGPVDEIIQLQLGPWRAITTERQAAEILITRFQNGEGVSLADHPPFRAIQTRCHNGKDPAQFEWYVDPINLVRAAFQGNFAASTGLAILPAIGADGIQAVGGNVTLSTQEFDQLHHIHLLLEPPRDGVVEVLALTQGSTEPEVWVPADVANYTTWHIDLKHAYATAKHLIDSFREEGSTQAFLDRRISEPLGVDFEQDLLFALSGRISRFAFFPPNATVNDAWTTLGIELTDAKRFAETLKKITDKHSSRIERVSYGGVELIQLKMNRDQPAEAPEGGDGSAGERRRRRRGELPPQWRQATPTAAIVGDYCVISNRREAVEQCVLAYNNTRPRLMDELEYKLVVSKLRRLSATPPGMVTFDRPEQGLKVMYQMLQNEDVRQNVHNHREDNPFFATLDTMFTENRFPPFAVISQYFAPSGMAIFNEETGFHVVSFGLRRQINSPLRSSP